MSPDLEPLKVVKEILSEEDILMESDESFGEVRERDVFL